jgi:hypothetical protein
MRGECLRGFGGVFMAQKARPSRKAKLSPELAKVELEPDAWDRFERLVDRAVKTRPSKVAPQGEHKDGKTRAE